MARIQLHRSFDLTAATRFLNPTFGPDERWLDFSNGLRIIFTPAGPDRISGLSLTQSGTPILTMSHFLMSTAPNAFNFSEVFQRGNWLPVWNTILASNDEIIGSSGRDVVNGLGGNDVIFGMAGDDRLFGGAGKDTLNGGPGNDLPDGGAGNDLLEAGMGADTVRGGAGIDTLHLQTGAGVAIDLTLTGAQTFRGGTVTISGVENLRGGAGNDRLAGNAQANVLEGGAGSDTLLGRGGNDILRGGQGNDTLEGGPGDDRLEGGAGADVLRGGAGNDRLVGGAGNDVLTGGAGIDSFVFRPGSDHDRITDFSDGQDRIVITDWSGGYGDLRIEGRGADTVIHFGANSITLTDVDANLLGTHDFIFG